MPATYIATSSDWSASVVIGQSNYFGFGFTTLNWKPLWKKTVLQLNNYWNSQF